MLKKINKSTLEHQAPGHHSPGNPSSLSYRQALTVTITLFILVNLCFDSLLFWKLHQSKIQYEKAAEIHVANLSKVLEQNVYTLLREIDLTLLDLSDAWHKQATIGVLPGDDFRALMQRHTERLPTVLGLRLADARGEILCSTGEVAQNNANIADRDHFTIVRDNPNSGMVIGMPILGRISHRWVLPVARRLSYPDGSFAGEIHASIATDTFSTMFSTLDLGQRGVVSMWDKTTTLARHPQTIKDRNTIGVSKPSPQLKSLLESETKSAQYRATAPTDGVLKTYAINKVGGFPLWTIVGLAESDYLAPWRSEVKEMELLGLIFAGVSLVSARQFFRYWKFSRRRIGEILIRETDEQLRAAQTLARIGSWIKDLRSETYIWSDEVYRILGLDSEDLGQQDNLLMSVVHPEDRSALAATLAFAAPTPGPHSLQFRIVRPDGSFVWLHLEGRLESSQSGAPERVLGFIHDITENKRGEEVRLNLERQILHSEKLKSLGVLAGGIAHDFNNILTAIVGNADLALARTDSDSPVAENLNRIMSASRKAADLAKQMLAYSGRGTFQIETLNLDTLLEDMRSLLEVSISKKATLKLSVSDSLPPVEADSTQMRQIVMNLVVNASESIGDRGGVIVVQIKRQYCDRSCLDTFMKNGSLEEGDYVLLEVSDNGCGMSPEVLAKIFDPFFSTKFTGRGLGMAAVLGIIRSHKGAIKVESEPGVGSCFTLMLPASAKAVHAVVQEPREGWKGVGKVLLVDDEEAVRSTAMELLKELEFDVISCNDGHQALELVKSNPDLTFVLLDLTMPNFDGEQCYYAIRDLGSQVKVVISSGYHESEIADRFTGKGLAGFLQKPYNISDLKKVLAKFLPE